MIVSFLFPLFVKKDCYFTGFKILITTGYRVGSNIASSEILNLNKSETWKCPDWPEYPMAVQGATGGMIGEKPVICGGFPFTNQCYVMTANKSQFLTNMTSNRGYATSVNHQDYLWITGGYKDNTNLISSTEKIKSDGTKMQGPNMPMPLTGHAMININKTFTMIIGGESTEIDASKKTFYFNHKTQNWTDGPHLNVGRSNFAAGIVTDDVTKENIVIVTGGYLQSTEILLDNQWKQGKR